MKFFLILWNDIQNKNEYFTTSNIENAKKLVVENPELKWIISNYPIDIEEENYESLEIDYHAKEHRN